MPGREQPSSGSERADEANGSHSASSATRRLAAVVASSDDAIFTKDRDAVITSWNAAAERLYGYSAAEAIGRPVAMLVPSWRASEERMILDRALAGETLDHYETERVCRDGRVVRVSLSVSPVRDEQGRIVEASVIARDVTEERRLQRRQARLQAVTAGLAEAVTVRDVVEVVLTDGFIAAEASAGFLARVVPGTRRLELIGAGYPAPGPEGWPEMTLDERLPVTDTLNMGESVWVADATAPLDAYPTYRDRFGAEGTGALAAMPLIVHGEVIGALALRFAEPQRFAEDEREFMETLARQCAQALDRARLYEREREARTRAEEARRRAEWLASAGELLSGSLDLDATLEQVARLAVPAIADWAFIELLQPDGSIERPVVVHSDPAKERWARALAERYPLDADAEYGSARVMRTGEPELTSEISDELLRAAAIDDEHLEVLRQVGFASAMVVPLRARGRILGDIALASAESGRHFDEADLAMAQSLAHRCALAIDNARLFSERSYIAKTLQEGLLPADLPGIPGVDLAVRYRAAGQEMQVGGDFYDVFAARGGWTFVVGDVVGKGPQAAAVTGLARHTVRAAASYEPRPADILVALNRAMTDQLADPEQFCTVCCARLEAGDGAPQLTVASGGHTLPYVIRADGTIQQVGRPGMLIGVVEEPVIGEETTTLRSGDTVVLYTDGVTEVRGPAGRFGEQQLEALLAMSVAMPPARLVERIERAVTTYHRGPLTDDVAIVVLRVR